MMKVDWKHEVKTQATRLNQIKRKFGPLLKPEQTHSHHVIFKRVLIECTF